LVGGRHGISLDGLRITLIEPGKLQEICDTSECPGLVDDGLSIPFEPKGQAAIRRCYLSGRNNSIRENPETRDTFHGLIGKERRSR
jgi:hypothetical protein